MYETFKFVFRIFILRKYVRLRDQYVIKIKDEWCKDEVNKCHSSLFSYLQNMILQITHKHIEISEEGFIPKNCFSIVCLN